MSNDLLNFRLKYLQFITKVWRDPHYLFALQHKDKGYLINSDINSDTKNNPHWISLFDLTRILEVEFDYKSEWNINFEVRVAIKSPVSSNPATERIAQSTDPLWDISHQTWRGPNDRFVLKIPIWPDESEEGNKDSDKAFWSKCPGWPIGDKVTPASEKDNNELKKWQENFKSRQKAEFLAAYYEQYPTIFGRTYVAERKEASDPGAGYPEQFLDFGMFIPRVIELAWNNGDFRNQLLNENVSKEYFQRSWAKIIEKIKGDLNPEIVKKISKEIGTETNAFDDEDKTRLLSTYFGFNNPWNFDIIFTKEEIRVIKEQDENEIEAINAKEKINGKKGYKGYLWLPGRNVREHQRGYTKGELFYKKKEEGTVFGKEFPANIVRLNFPMITNLDSDINFPLVLNTYNCTGPAYPFTCV